MISRARAWLRDPMVVGLALACVLVGTIAGVRGDEEDIDQRVYEAAATEVRAGADYYTAMADAIEEKEGVPPTQVRSIRPPTLTRILALFPPSWWPWLAVLPAFVLCLAAAWLAGPSRHGAIVATGVVGLWMVVSLPLLHLHHELWGAPLLLVAAVAHAERRDGVAAVLCLAATAIRELFGLSLLVGCVFGRDRRPWFACTAVAGLLAVLHARAASEVLDPSGFDPPLEPTDPLIEYASPGSSGVAYVLGIVLIGLAGLGLWRSWRRRDISFLALSLIPVAVLGVFGGRNYWALTWCGFAGALTGLAVSSPSGRATKP